MRNRFTHFFLLILPAGYVLAQLPGWKLDKAHSSITFTVPHLVISEVTGSFRDFDIEAEVPDDDFTRAKVSAAIKAASINTDNERRDDHLRSDDFFNAEQFPLITFRSTSVEQIDDKNYELHGDLTIRDVTKRVTFHVVHNGTLTTPRATISAWRATTTINRFDFGLKWNRMLETGGLVAGSTVNITIRLELQKPTA